MNQLLALSSEQRQTTILNRLRSQGRVAVAPLSAEFDVSEATIRRDLRQMAARGLLQRVHGGAISAPPLSRELPFLQRTRLHAAEKQRIGAAAAGLVNPGDTVILLGGSTTLEVAPHLSHVPNLTVITDSLLIAQSIAQAGTATVILLGGVVRSSELTTGGHLAQLCLQELRANKVIFGVAAVSFDQGLLLDAVGEVTVFRQCIQAAQEAILVVDYSKFGQVATAALGPITLVRRIVTDPQISPDICARLRGLNLDVVLA